MMSSRSRMECSCVQEGRDWKMRRQYEIFGAALLAALASTCALADDVVINLNGGQQTGSFDGRGPITCSYTVHGPGTFFSTGRVYPNNTAYTVTFDQGAVVWLTTHNARTDGLIVSGNQSCEVHLADCTVGSMFSAETCLARYVTLVLDDSDAGANITTRNSSGTPIVIQTNPSQVAIMKGSGNLNLVGGGIFRFDSKTTFAYTGTTTVDDGTEVVVATAAPPVGPFVVKDGGVLTVTTNSVTNVRNLPRGHVTVKRNGVFDVGVGSVTVTLAGGMTLEDGSVLRMTVGAASPMLDTKSIADWNNGTGVYFPKGGGKVIVSPRVGTGLAAGRYTLVNNVQTCGIEAFALDASTLGGYNIGLDRDGDALVLVVSEDDVPSLALWTGGASGSWSDANWNGGELFPEGKGARFATAGAAVSLASPSPLVRRISFDESATIAGDGALNLALGEFHVAAGCTATIDAPISVGNDRIMKYGAGTLAVNAGKLGTVPGALAFEGQLELHLQSGETVMVADQPDIQARDGGISFIGPGTFTYMRSYPRNYGSTNVIDGGATAILSGRTAGDGMIVSGWRTGESIEQAGVTALGNCTIKSANNMQTLLQRDTAIVFTDVTTGATISTESAAGVPITVTTAGAGVFYGAGRLNIAGSGTFVFSSSATFAQTGETTVKGGATARLEADVPSGSFRVESGGTLTVVDATRSVGSVSFEAGSAFSPVLNATAKGALSAVNGVAWPSSGTVNLKLAGGAKLQDGEYTVLANAGADALAHLTLTILIPGKAAELFMDGNDLKVRITIGEYLDLVWKGGDGAWSDADGWNDDEWIDFSRATFPAAGGTVTLSQDVNVGSLSFLGPYTIAGSRTLTNLAEDNVLRADADVAIEPEYVPSTRTLVKTGGGMVAFSNASSADGTTFTLQGGGVVYSQPAEGVARVNYSADTTFGLGGGTIVSGNIANSAGTNVLLNGTVLMNSNQLRTVAGSTLVYDNGAAVSGEGARFWVYSGGHVVLGENCGKLRFAGTTMSSYVGAADSGTRNRLTILGGELEVLVDDETLPAFCIGSRPEVGVTGIVHMVAGALTTSNTIMGRRWDSMGDDPCESYGELVMDGGTFTSGSLIVGSVKCGQNYGEGAAVLRFNGGTALLGKFHTFPLTDRDILFNGTTFKPLADADDFFLARPCRQRETIAVGAGGLVFDTDGHKVGCNFSPSGDGGLVKRGAGTLTLKADLPCTGPVSVEAGTLAFEGTRTIAGGVTVASGAEFAPGRARVTVGGTLTFADGAVLVLDVTGGAAGTFAASTCVQQGALTIALAAPESYSGTSVLIEDLTGFDAGRISVTGLPAGATVEAAGNCLMLYGASASVWKGGAGTWADADGWSGSAWVDGSAARFATETGSEVTLGETVQVASLGFAESASILSGAAGAAIALGGGEIAVPAGRTAVIAPRLEPQGGLVKRGAGTLILGGEQNALGSVRVESGALEVAGAAGALGSFSVDNGATARFADGASVMTALARCDGELSASGVATLEAQTFEITPDLVIPSGLTVHAQTIPYVTVTNNVTGFTVNGALVCDDTLTVGYVLNGTGARLGNDVYDIAGDGVLRVPQMHMRTLSTLNFTVNRLEITGPCLYAPYNGSASDSGCWGKLAFDGTTVAPCGGDVSSGVVQRYREVEIVLRDGGVTFCTLDAADGVTARTISLTDGTAFISGDGGITKTGPGTLLMSLEQTYTGPTRVEGGTIKVMSRSSTSVFTASGEGSLIQFAGALGEMPSVSLGAGAKVLFGDGETVTSIRPNGISGDAGSAIEVIAGGGSACIVPFLDLRGCDFDMPQGTPVRVVMKAAIPNGTYDIVGYGADEAAKIADFAFSFVDEAGSGCTGRFETIADEGMVRLVIDGSQVMPSRNVWLGRGATGNWSEAVNWVAAASPFEGASLVFDGTRGLTNVNNTGSTAFPSMVFEEGAGQFLVDLQGAGQGMNAITNSSTVRQVVRGYSNGMDLNKSGGGELELVNPMIGGRLVMDSGSPLALRSESGVTVTVNSNGGGASAGPLSYLGPGSFLTSRIYPYSAAVPVKFDEGAIVWITTHNKAKDGLIVAGGKDRYLLAGRCTIGSRFTDPMTELLRAVTIEFTDAAVGATVTTDNVEGTPITIQTTCNASASTRNNSCLRGTGRFNIGGHGTFVFNPQTTFEHTGTTFVEADATAVVKPSVEISASPVTVVGTLRFEGGVLARPVTVASGGLLEYPGAASLGGITLEAGAKVRIAVAADGSVASARCAVTPPEEGKVEMELAFAEGSVVEPNAAFALTSGAGLARASVARFEAKATCGGAAFAADLIAKPLVENGELVVVFRPRGTMIYLR